MNYEIQYVMLNLTITSLKVGLHTLRLPKTQQTPEYSETDLDLSAIA